MRAAAVATLLGLVGAMPIRPRPELAEDPKPVPVTGGRLLPGHQWIRHQGKQQRLRILRQSMRRIEKLRDEASIAALARLRASVAHEPDPEYAVLHLAHTAMLAATETSERGFDVSWAASMNHLLNRFEERARADAAQA